MPSMRRQVFNFAGTTSTILGSAPLMLLAISYWQAIPDFFASLRHCVSFFYFSTQNLTQRRKGAKKNLQ
jgi:hypothetical protein